MRGTECGLKTSIIWLRVADFLRQYPPFQYFTEADLLELAHSGRVTFHQAGEFLFQQGSARRDWVWVLQQGTVEIVNEQGRVTDIVSAGDILGLGCALNGDTYLHGARTTSDVMIYTSTRRASSGCLANTPKRCALPPPICRCMGTAASSLPGLRSRRRLSLLQGDAGTTSSRARRSPRRVCKPAIIYYG